MLDFTHGLVEKTQACSLVCRALGVPPRTGSQRRACQGLGCPTLLAGFRDCGLWCVAGLRGKIFRLYKNTSKNLKIVPSNLGSSYSKPRRKLLSQVCQNTMVLKFRENFFRMCRNSAEKSEKLYRAIAAATTTSRDENSPTKCAKTQWLRSSGS